MGSINEVSGGAFELVDVHLVFLRRADEGKVEAFAVLPDVDDALQNEVLYFGMEGNCAGKGFVQLWDGVVADVNPTDLRNCCFSGKADKDVVRSILDP